MTRRALLQALLLAGASALPALVSGFVQLRHEQPLGPDEVRVATAKRWGAQALFVDARTAARFEAGHIEGAVRLTTEDWETLFPKFADAWEPGQNIVVYCDGGGCEASHEVAAQLRGQLEGTFIFILKGGWPAWQRE